MLALMAVVLLLLGYIIGAAFAGMGGAYIGVLVAAGLWLILTLISFAGGDQIFLAASRATPITKDVHPQLFNIVEEMTLAASLPKVPKIYIINDPAPNAFATGRKPETASVAVTAGLLGRLNRDELQGVIAHEISHIVHRDILFITIAGVMLGAIVMLSQVFLRGMFYSSMMGGSRRRYSSSSSSGGGAAQLIMMLVAIICAILAPIFAYLLYFALSRRREYLADAGAARLTRYPPGLANALEKISNNTTQLSVANKVTAPMYICNPLQKKGMKLSDLTSTHPPISERVKILRSMAGGASYNDYSKAFAATTKHHSPLPAAALQGAETVELRQGTSEKASRKQSRKQARQVGDIMRKVNQFAFISCTCGLKMKIPPNFKSTKISCPRCGVISPIS